MITSHITGKTILCQWKNLSDKQKRRFVGLPVDNDKDREFANEWEMKTYGKKRSWKLDF